MMTFCILDIWEVTGGFPSQKDCYAKRLVFGSINELLNKQSSCRWFETPWRACDVTVMYETRQAENYLWLSIIQVQSRDPCHIQFIP